MMNDENIHIQIQIQIWRSPCLLKKPSPFREGRKVDSNTENYNEHPRHPLNYPVTLSLQGFFCWFRACCMVETFIIYHRLINFQVLLARKTTDCRKSYSFKKNYQCRTSSKLRTTIYQGFIIKQHTKKFGYSAAGYRLSNLTEDKITCTSKI